MKIGIQSIQLKKSFQIYSPNSGKLFTKLVTEADSLIAQNAGIYTAIRQDNGVYVIDKLGNIIQQFTTSEGLQNNNVLSICVDGEQNLWLGLDNGIDLIMYNSAIKQVKPLFKNGSGYTSAVYNSKLFLGTSNGLFSVPIVQNNDLSFTKGNFTSIENLKGQVWGLSTINNALPSGSAASLLIIIKLAALLIHLS